MKARACRCSPTRLQELCSVSRSMCYRVRTRYQVQGRNIKRASAVHSCRQFHGVVASVKLRLRAKHARPNPARSPLASLAPGTCEELQDAAQATSSDDVVGELTNGGVSCDAWTTFEIAANRLKLVAPDGSSSDNVFVFNNVRFLVASAATLRVLPMVELTGGDASQV